MQGYKYLRIKELRKKIVFLILIVIFVAGFLFWHFHHQAPSRKNNYSADILITNAEVLTLDANSDIYNPGWVEIKEGKIIGLGKGSAPANIVAAKIINGSGDLVMPGLVDTHSHSAMTLLRGLDDNDAFEPWLKNVSVYEQHLTPDDVYWGSLLAEDEMIRDGTTAFNDMYFDTENTAQAVTQAGMRAVLRVSTTDNNGQVAFDNSIAKQNQNNPLITYSLAPNPFLDYTPAELKQISDYALQNNYLVHLHFEEDPQNRSDSLTKYNLTPTQLIQQAGFLRNKLVLAHAADVNQQEIDLLAQYPNVGISYNPKSEAKLGPALTSVAQVLNSGITVGVGTDGAASSNSLDMFGQINFAAYGFLKCSAGQKFCQNGYTINPEKIVRMATIDGAKILGLDNEIGSLETGKQADVIVLDLQQAHLQPVYDIYSTLVYNTSGADVLDSIINGKMVMENRQLLTINESEVFQKAQGIAESLKSLK